MENERKLKCVVAQIRQEKETRGLLDNSHISESRKEQIVEKRKADVRRRYGLSMDDDIKI